MFATVLSKGHTDPRCLSGEGLPPQNLRFPPQGTMATTWQAAFTGLQHLQWGRTSHSKSFYRLTKAPRAGACQEDKFLPTL